MRKHGSLCGVIACLVAYGSVSSAATRYAVPPGTAGVLPTLGYSSWATAATTLQSIVSVALPGDQVFVSNGTYYLKGEIKVTNITVSSWRDGQLDRDGTIIDGNYPFYTNRCLYLVTNATVQGFTIRNGRVAGLGGGVFLGKDATLRNCRVTENCSSASGGGGIAANAGFVTNCEVIGNVGTNYGGGVYLTGGARLYFCLVAQNTVNGAAPWGGGVYGTGNGTLVHQCIIVSNMSVGASSAGSAVALESGAQMRNSLVAYHPYCWQGTLYARNGARVENCTVVSNAASGLATVSGPTGSNTIVNTIVYTNAPYDIWRVGGSSTELFISNCLWGTSRNITVGVPIPATDYGTGNITNLPPLFENAEAGNFRPKGNSPCIDAGLTLPWLADATDLDGNRRVIGVTSLVDMGCYEYVRQGTLLYVR